jgi:hypothetical protein
VGVGPRDGLGRSWKNVKRVGLDPTGRARQQQTEQLRFMQFVEKRRRSWRVL